eukprot:CAMPEP_0114228356 /NCGR_PEP_ID=MMETSP0058-20121206/2295_1 /TAXON_ID=36894 /ORGANISM="Pyramimonas parkeae, CCMP726" /LENGTH=99 /DNA_ID=CAMNT_0001339289 /DNA_START=394 /DNA_END=693 /DNA_ORIENTATION=+
MAVLSSGERVVGGHHVRGRASANCSATHVGHAPRAVEEPPILDLAEHDIGRVLMRDLAVAAGSLMVHPNTAQLLRMLLTQTMIQLEEPSEVLADALGSG